MPRYDQVFLNFQESGAVSVEDFYEMVTQFTVPARVGMKEERSAGGWRRKRMFSSLSVFTKFQLKGIIIL